MIDGWSPNIAPGKLLQVSFCSNVVCTSSRVLAGMICSHGEKARPALPSGQPSFDIRLQAIPVDNLKNLRQWPKSVGVPSHHLYFEATQDIFAHLMYISRC